MKLSHSQICARRIKNKRKGFSLVEVIIAIGIVGLLLTGFLGVFGSAQRNISRSLGVKEANTLKSALETEMTILRTSDTDYDSSFHKAFDMIKNSSTESEAIIIYQYKADPVDSVKNTGDLIDDGILPPFTDDNGIQGQSYLTQVAVRKKGKDDDLMINELTRNTVVGNVYAVRMTQLLENVGTGDLELSANRGQIFHEVGGVNVEVVDQGAIPDYQVYNKAVITFQAEFFKIPSNTSKFVIEGDWVFGTSTEPGNMGSPVAVVNLAIRR